MNKIQNAKNVLEDSRGHRQNDANIIRNKNRNYHE